MFKFTRIDKDSFELDFNGEKHIITTDLEKVVQLQQVDFEARVLLNKKLKDLGVTLEDLQYEKKENGKTIVDDSQLQLLLEECKKEATYNKIKKIVKDTTNLDLLQLATELGADEFQKFVSEFVVNLSGTDKTPSKK